MQIEYVLELKLKSGVYVRICKPHPDEVWGGGVISSASLFQIIILFTLHWMDFPPNKILQTLTWLEIVMDRITATATAVNRMLV